MTRQTNRQLMEAFAFAQDPGVMAEDVSLCDLAQERTFHGREAVTALLHAFFLQGFTSIRTEVQAMVVDEEEVALAFVFRGRQDGLFMGIPPTRLEVNLPMVVLCRIQAGQIQQAALYYNAGTLLRQLRLGW
jgi:predicted ester cyclase